MDPVLTRLTLKNPIDLDSSRAKRGKRSKHFWREIRIAAVIFAVSMVAIFLWDRWSLPEFELNGHLHPWIFPLYMVGVIHSVQRGSAALRSERERRREEIRLKQEAAFEAEIFPFLRAELTELKGEDDFGHLPPRGWLISRMTATKGEDPGIADWSSRYGDTDSYSHNRVSLENGGTEVVFASTPPEGI